MAQEDEPDDGVTTSPTRQKSGIVFPYDDLATGIKIASIVHDTYGGECGLDQLAASLNNTVSSGGFRLKVGATRIFGLINTANKRVAITDLGARAVDDRTAVEAAVEAFLNAPLYSAVYERFHGRNLPAGDSGLENVFRDLGVPEKQLTTARQVFFRSAKQAGFLTHGRERLVAPPKSSGSPMPSIAIPEPPPAAPDVPVERIEQGVEGKHEMLVSLFRDLPDRGMDWKHPGDRERWKSMLDNTLDYLWPASATNVRATTAPTMSTFSTERD